MEPTRIEYPSFADLPSLEELVRLAETSDWLLIQVPSVEVVGEHGKRLDGSREDRKRIIGELGLLLPEHKLWDSGFLPDEASLPAARQKVVRSLISGMARFSVRRRVTERVFEDHLDLLARAASEYRDLANVSMRRLARHLQTDVGEFAADAMWHRHEQIGRFATEEDGEWAYFFHGQDCAFTSRDTGITVEARLGYGAACGEDFGVFDPAFFLGFVKGTLRSRSDYEPIVDVLHDGWNDTLEFMERRGILRRVSSEALFGGGWVLVGDGTE